MSCILTHSDLNGRSLAELQILHRRLLTLLADARPGSTEYREGFANLQTVCRAIRQRQHIPTPRF